MFEGKVPSLRYLEVSAHFEDNEQLFVLRDPSGISTSTLLVSAELFNILNYFDGEHTLLEIQNKINEEDQNGVDLEKLNEIYSLFNESCFLNNKDFFDYRKKVLEDFSKQKTRDSIIVTDDLPQSADKLDEFFDHLKQSPPPDDFEGEEIDKEKAIKGLMLPHIDYYRGGMTYGRTYKIFEESIKDVTEPILFVIIGVAHAGIKYPLSFTPKDFISPYGAAQSEKNILNSLEKKLGNWIYEEEWIHKNEHSIELQVLWLQHILKDRQFSILPILTGHFDPEDSPWLKYIPPMDEIISTLHEQIQSFDGRVVFISSVDFAHVGLNFGDDKIIDDKWKIKIEKSDNLSLEDISNCHAEDWWENIDSDKNERRVCGHYANYVALKLLNGSKGYLIDYDQAVAEDSSQLVSFASAIFQ